MRVGIGGWEFWILLLLAACAAPPPPAPVTLRVETTDLTQPLLSDLTAAYATVNPNVSFASKAVSLSAMAADLAAGQADLGLAATLNPDQFATPLGYVLFVVIVHPANPIANLSVAQMHEIFAGRVTDWALVGVGSFPAASLPGSSTSGEIQVVGREENSDAARTFETSVLGGMAPPSTALVAPTWPAMREAVSQNPHAIGYVITPELDSAVKAVSLDAELRALVVATAPREPTGPARAFLAWAQSEAGQNIVAQKYAPVK